MAYLNGKFTCFSPQINFADDTLAMAMNNAFPAEFYSRAQQITTKVFWNVSSEKLYLPDCEILAYEAIRLRRTRGGEVYLPKIRVIGVHGLATLNEAEYLLLGEVGNGLKWSSVDPEQELSSDWSSNRMTVYLDETQADYLDFADYLLIMANEIELYDSTGEPIEV